MNNVLQQLIALSPGIAQGVTGNGRGMQAFMQAYQRQSALMDENDRRNQDQSLQRQQIDYTRTRQGEMDRIAAEDRTARQAQQAQADALQRLQIPGQLAELGGTADTPDDAKRLIETTLPGLMSAFGQETMAYGQPAVEMATRTITARQKRQVSEFVTKAINTSFVADNPEADPEITNLPEHLQKIIGKPSAKLSELQSFAELPVGKPQGKTRTPAAAGSFEDFVEKKYGPNATPEQIVEARKIYADAGREPNAPPKTGPGGIDPSAASAALKFQDDYARDSKPYITVRDAYQRVKSAKPDAAGDLSMIFAFMKLLDPNSVVREQEFANAQNAAGVPDRVRNLYNQMMQGTRLAPEQRQQFIAQADALFETSKTNQRQVRTTYGSRAKQWGIPENMVLDAEDEFLRPAQTAPQRGANPFRKGGQ